MKAAKHLLLLILIQINSVAGHEGSKRRPPRAFSAILGRDDRQEFHQANSEILRTTARATAAILSKKKGFLERTVMGFRLSASTPTHGAYDGLCSDEPFFNQPAPADCSSFLVAPDLLMTAAHCMEEGCGDSYFVFDFISRAPNHIQRTFREEQVFSCRRIERMDRERDWAIVRLERSVPGRQPLNYRRDGQPMAGDPVALVGFPRGVPMKIAAGARVLPSNTSVEDPNFFQADLDTFGGNSGGPVVNTRTGIVEGIHAFGYGQTMNGFRDPVTGRPCKRLQRWQSAAESTPAPWVVRASSFSGLLRQVTSP